MAEAERARQRAEQARRDLEANSGERDSWRVCGCVRVCVHGFVVEWLALLTGVNEQPPQ